MSISPVRMLVIFGAVAALATFASWFTGIDAGEAGAEPLSHAISELPLARGYYVRTDATCATASNATTALLRRQGLFWYGSFCTFQGIEQTGPTTFRVKHYCSDPRAPEPPTPIPEDWLMIADWVITDRGSFSFTDSEGWEHEARLCPQRDMPVAYHDDIAELIE